MLNEQMKTSTFEDTNIHDGFHSKHLLFTVVCNNVPKLLKKDLHEFEYSLFKQRILQDPLVPST